MADLRLGDVIDDWCVKCRRLTNHSIVSIVGGTVAKVRCRTCYHDHDYRHEEAPPSKKDLKKQALFDEVLASINPDAATAENNSEAALPDPLMAAEHPANAPDETTAAADVTGPPQPPLKKKGPRKARNSA